MPGSLQFLHVDGNLAHHQFSTVPSWLPDGSALPAPLPHIRADHRLTAFPVLNTTETAGTHCSEGFRCISRVSKFGRDHVGSVSADNAAEARKNGELLDQGERDKQARLYEWNCPADDGSAWASDRYEAGPGEHQCNEEGDCLCVARGSPDSHTEVNNGEERRMQRLDVESGCGKSVERMKEPVTVIPHYPLREVRAHYDPDSPYSIIGEVAEYPRKMWLEKFTDVAPRLQYSLDSLKSWIDESYAAHIKDKPYICGDASGGGGDKGLSTMALAEAKAKLMRFQLLSSDCESMRDTVPRLMPASEEESWAESGAYRGKALNCEHPGEANGKTGKSCRQLNCYRGPDDAELQVKLQEYESKIAECFPKSGAQPDADLSQGSSLGASAASAPPPGPAIVAADQEALPTPQSPLAGSPVPQAAGQASSTTGQALADNGKVPASVDQLPPATGQAPAAADMSPATLGQLPPATGQAGIEGASAAAVFLARGACEALRADCQRRRVVSRRLSWSRAKCFL